MQLEELNSLSHDDAKQLLFKCCGSSTWVDAVAAKRPFKSIADLNTTAEDVWKSCTESDWLEAFKHHPEIGDLESLKKKFASTSQWASGEQGSVSSATTEVLERLRDLNKEYKERFGFIFIICATGRSATEMLAALEKRINNFTEQEIVIAAEEQRKIMHLRIDKLLA